jgi:acyl carrier protein
MASLSNVEETIKDYVMREFLPEEDPTQLTGTTPLITTGILDSIAVLKLVMFLEEHYSITIEPHEASPEYLDTLGNICELVRSKS